MAYFFVQDGQIVGTTDDPNSTISGFEIQSGPDLPPEQLYWDGAEIRAKSERPSPLHVWHESGWALPTISVIPEQENWERLVAALRGTSLWEKVYTAAGRTLRANVSWTLLYGTLTRTHNLDDFQFAIADLRQAMIGISTIGDFSPEELEQINQVLSQNGFALQLS